MKKERERNWGWNPGRLTVQLGSRHIWVSCFSEASATSEAYEVLGGPPLICYKGNRFQYPPPGKSLKDMRPGLPSIVATSPMWPLSPGNMAYLNRDVL